MRDEAEIRAVVMAAALAPFAGDAEWLDRLFPQADAAARRDLIDLHKRCKASSHGLADATKESGTRLAALRAVIAERGLDGFIIPRTDEHLGEYIAVGAQRLHWLSGYSGSNGAGIVLSDKAAIVADGRYTLQIDREIDPALFTNVVSDQTPLAAWLARNLPSGAKLGYDPWLHAPGEIERLWRACAEAGASLVPVEPNPIDALWSERPPEPLGVIVPHAETYAGESAEGKRARLGASMDADAAVIGAAESVAWLLNVRGADAAFLPLPLSRAILREDGGADWFVDRRKLARDIDAHLGGAVRILPPDAFGAALDALGRQRARVRACPEGAPIWIHQRLAKAGASIRPAPDPCALPRACKNAVEIEGARQASLRDGVAMTRFLAFMAREAPKGTLTEIDAAETLLAFRRELPLFQGRSINTISSTGANGAVIHYRPHPDTNLRILPGYLYLVDSGAQFLDGTTDITRTIAVGPPSEEQRRRFTLVLKGAIGLSLLRFPAGATGTHLDVIARQFLWREGLDFSHGSGHGVGSYLGVHEGPQRIAKLMNTTALAPGMIVSNEPGYYKPGQYGMRFENLLVVQPVDDLPQAEQPMLRFETLSLAPIDRALIDASLLSGCERQWIDAYHSRVGTSLRALLGREDAIWLADATRPLVD